MAGIYFGKPRGFGTNDNGEETGFNTEVYSASEVTPPSISYYTSNVSLKNIFKKIIVPSLIVSKPLLKKLIGGVRISFLEEYL